MTPFIHKWCDLTFSLFDGPPLRLRRAGRLWFCGTSTTHPPQPTVRKTRTKTPPCLWRHWSRPLMSVKVEGGVFDCPPKAKIIGGFKTAFSKIPVQRMWIVKLLCIVSLFAELYIYYIKYLLIFIYLHKIERRTRKRCHKWPLSGSHYIQALPRSTKDTGPLTEGPSTVSQKQMLWW